MEIITTHKHTDFDGLASVIAAAILHKNAVAVIPKNINPNVRGFLSIHKDMFDIKTHDQIDTDKVEKLIVVDTNRWDRLDGMKKLQEKKNLEILLWDHHSNQGDIKAQISVIEPVGAAVSLMIREIRAKNKDISPIQATLFLAGLYEDTGNLTFSCTTPLDAYAAGFLLEKKADLNVIGAFLSPAYGQKQKDMLFSMLQSAEIVKLNGNKVSINKQVIKEHIDRLAVVVRMYREILNVDAAFGIFENKEKSKTIVIGRCTAANLDAGEIMRCIGGGGHPGAGSAMLDRVGSEKIEEKLIQLITGSQKSSVHVGDLMSFPVYCLPQKTSMKDALNLLREKGCTGVPIVDENDNLAGVISRRDFKKIKNKKAFGSPVKAYMSVKVITIEPGASPRHAANIMVKHDIGRLPAVQDGKIIGIITRSDVMRYFYDLPPD